MPGTATIHLRIRAIDTSRPMGDRLAERSTIRTSTVRKEPRQTTPTGAECPGGNVCSGDSVRILVLTEMYPRKKDPAAGIFVHRECLVLKRAGVDLRVLSPIPYSPRVLWLNSRWKRQGLVPASDVWDGIPVRYPRYPRPPGRFFRKFEPFAIFPSVCASFARWSRENRFDIIHAHGLLPCGMTAVLLSKAFRVPCVCQARGSDVNVYPWESNRNLLLTRSVIDRCDVPVAVSKDLARKMSSLSRSRRDVALLYTTVDANRFSPAVHRTALRRRLQIPPKSYVVLYVGDLICEKGVLDLIKAWEEVHRSSPDSLLFLLGKGPLSAVIRGESPGIYLCGPKRHEEVSLWMQASDMLVLASYSEGLPTVVVEAMACGLPVVATNVGGTPEAVVHGETGFLVAPKDHRELASRIVLLARNPDLCKTMGDAARKRIEMVFPWENYVAGAMEVYRTAIERHKQRASRGALTET